MEWIHYLLPIASVSLGLFTFLSLGFAVISLTEKEMRAVKRALALSLCLILILVLHLILSPVFALVISIPVIISFFLVILLIAWKDTAIPNSRMEAKPRIDERDIMFSRRLLKKGSEKYDEYYRAHPELKAKDDVFRSKPGLLARGSKYYDEGIFEQTKAIFHEVDQYHKDVVQKPNRKGKTQNPEQLWGQIQSFLLASGAHSAGSCIMRAQHYYSHGGKAWNYGEPIDPVHQYAIAFTVEMDHQAMSYAPEAPVVRESARQYLNAARLAVEISKMLSGAGYEARANIDGNYHVVCPLVARDAGLGEIGRMGLLMTPKLGPRVRIGVVTTNCPLPVSDTAYDHSVREFCAICKKCADACPSKAIPCGDEELHDGVKRWKISSEACYTYWCIAGTDCGKCMQICPYSHPNNAMHNVIRWMIRRSSIARKFALKMDDFFYGKK